MKKSEDSDLQRKSGLFLGSEPLEDVRHRRSYKMAGDDSDKTDADGDAGDDDATDSDDADSDLTDKKDASDTDGRD